MEEIIKELKLILRRYKFLHWYSWADRYFVKKKNVDKLVVYFYEKTNYVMFWLSFQWTEILDKYPMLKIACDEVWKSTLKWKICSIGDIERKWIPSVVENLAEYYGIKW